MLPYTWFLTNFNFDEYFQYIELCKLSVDERNLHGKVSML
jgi:hypothetical protein